MFDIFKINKWILLVLIVISPFITHFLMMTPDFYLEIGIKAMSIILLIYWYYSIDIRISKKINVLIKLLYIYMAIYPIIFLAYFFPITTINSGQPEFLYVMPFHISYMIFFITLLIRISKKMKEVLNTSDAFWKLLFYPIGIVLFHPQMNKKNLIMNYEK